MLISRHVAAETCWVHVTNLSSRLGPGLVACLTEGSSFGFQQKGRGKSGSAGQKI